MGTALYITTTVNTLTTQQPITTTTPCLVEEVTVNVAASACPVPVHQKLPVQVAMKENVVTHASAAARHRPVVVAQTANVAHARRRLESLTLHHSTNIWIIFFTTEDFYR